MDLFGYFIRRGLSWSGIIERVVYFFLIEENMKID
jgi:hypothetical protein